MTSANSQFQWSNATHTHTHTQRSNARIEQQWPIEAFTSDENEKSTLAAYSLTWQQQKLINPGNNNDEAVQA